MNAAGPDSRKEAPDGLAYHGESYYGQPAVRPSPWDWKIAAYLFTSAFSGGAQLIAAIADRFGGARMRHVARNGRYLAAIGSAVGPALLVRDLKTPQRWYNMLRIFRRTSPMSIGSFALSAFGVLSALTALKELVSERISGPTKPGPTELAAAVTGVAVMTYTAPLLSSTSTPLWAAEPELLAARFGSSAVALAAAGLSLIEQMSDRPENARTLDRLALVAAAANGLFSRAAEQRYASTGVGDVLREEPRASLHKQPKLSD
jgi:protein NrfD